MVSAPPRFAVSGEQPVVEMSILSKADGSASWKSVTGSTALTSVHGPIEVRIRDELLGEATLELKIVPSSGQGGTRERYLEGLIRSGIKPCLLLRLHPRSLIQITCQIIAIDDDDDDEQSTLDLVATIINSIILACVDAGISMQCMMAAGLTRLPNGSEHLVCYTYPNKELIMVDSRGSFDKLDLADALDAAQSQCDAAFEIMKSSIEQRITKNNRWRVESD